MGSRNLNRMSFEWHINMASWNGILSSYNLETPAWAWQWRSRVSNMEFFSWTRWLSRPTSKHSESANNARPYLTTEWQWPLLDTKASSEYPPNDTPHRWYCTILGADSLSFITPWVNSIKFYHSISQCKIIHYIAWYFVHSFVKYNDMIVVKIQLYILPHSNIFYYNVKLNLENEWKKKYLPPRRIELRTFRLLSGCSTTEL